MEILDGTISLDEMQTFIDTYRGKEGIVVIRPMVYESEDMKFTFVPNEMRWMHLGLSINDQMNISAVYPEMRYRGPGHENEDWADHRQRVETFVKSHGYFVWGDGNIFAKWAALCYELETDEDGSVVRFYSVTENGDYAFDEGKPKCPALKRPPRKMKRVVPPLS